MNPREYPDDELIARWSADYGTTGVKFYELTLGENAGCVAAFREFTLTERTLLARLTPLAEDGAFDLPRMMVSTALLYPSVDLYPNPVFAIFELYGYIRQYGRGPLEEDEPVHGSLPEHMVTDIRNARRAAHLIFEDSEHTTLYKDLVLALAIGMDGAVDPLILDRLWAMPPGRLRDLLATVEQSNHILLTEALARKGVDRKLAQQTYRSPFAPLDTETGGATVPGFEQTPTEPTAVESVSIGNLPPNLPRLTVELREALEG